MAASGRIPASGDRIVRPRSLAALAPHQPVEGGEIGARAPLGEELGRTHGGQLLGNGCRDELVDADAVRFRSPFDLGLDRAGQAEWVGALVLHVLILRMASAGVSTSIPNPTGTAPKSRRLNVTIAAAR